MKKINKKSSKRTFFFLPKHSILQYNQFVEQSVIKLFLWLCVEEYCTWLRSQKNYGLARMVYGVLDGGCFRQLEKQSANGSFVGRIGGVIL